MRRDFAQVVWSPQVAEDLRRIVRLAVFEDLDRGHDWTTVSLVPEEARAAANIVVRKPGVIAGIPAVCVILDEMEIEAEFHPQVQDGDVVAANAVVGTISGAARDVLTSERIILNVMGRLCGIATLTRQYVEAVAGTKARIYDTRKTIPGWRRLDKYGVHCGGGHNHRAGLYDGILIKDNHLAFGREERPVGGPVNRRDHAAFEPADAVRKARDFLAAQFGSAGDPPLLLEIEVDTLDQLREVLPERPDLVLLDNMTPEMLREAVRLRDEFADEDGRPTRFAGAPLPTTELEASGGVNLKTVLAIAETGVERISLGALTHSAATLDLGLDFL